MSFCVNCGAELTEGMKFCPSCGQPVGTRPAAVETPVQPETIDFSAPVARSDYSVILVSQGTATKTALKELLEDLLGYTTTQARKLTNGMVMEVACGLTAEQAVYVAQAMTEYGAQVAISTPSGFVDAHPLTRTSVFNNAGYLTAAVTAALSTITAANRVSVFTPLMRGDAFQHIFAPAFRRIAPPIHMRQTMRSVPSRRPPVPRPAPAPRPAPPRAVRPAASKAPRPAPPMPPAARPSPRSGGVGRNGSGGRGPRGPGGRR